MREPYRIMFERRNVVRFHHYDRWLWVRNFEHTRKHAVINASIALTPVILIFSHETTWELAEYGAMATASLLHGEGHESNQIYRSQECIPDGCYALTIYNDFGDW